MGGVVTFSMEVELGWGNHDTGELGCLSSDGRMERNYLSKLLAVTERNKIPFTFDVVGHLFLEECSGNHESPHPDSWFHADPGSDYQTDGLFYAPDIISELTSTTIEHEICTHTFSHALFDEISRDVSAWELERVQELHCEYVGEPTVSLVPPRHQSPPYDILVDKGIEVVRPPMQNQARTKFHRFKELLAGPLPLSDLQKSGDIVETYVTTNPTLTAAPLPPGQGKAHPAFRYLPVSLRKRYHLKKLQQATMTAVEEDSHLHLWCHLFDISNEHQFDVVQEYLDWLGSFQQNHDLSIAPMQELPNYV
jgi:hypothetical protein